MKKNLLFLKKASAIAKPIPLVPPVIRAHTVLLVIGRGMEETSIKNLARKA